MLPYGRFYSWLDHSAEYLQEEQSSSSLNLIKSMELELELDGMRSKAERKSTDACKSHREAERRRRQRINAHLATLRSLLPNAAKSDKASLLAEVVQHVKDLKKQAEDVARRHDGDSSCSGGEAGSDDSAATKPWPFPGESDEATVSYCEGDGKTKLMKSTVCCEDRPSLNWDIKRAIESVRAKAVRAEMMTVGGRTKSVVVVQWCGGDSAEEGDIGALERALKAVVDNRALVGSGMGRLGHKRARDSNIDNR